ncbi:hypothetical protein CF8_2383 [Nocardioides sp. CF8]|uniref:hypothetical protein n=1 Tax=Nocardioides sp. CF8 TaxID=110319 RepID=UPI00032FC93A|nr:hypothetical protein [Nocardioides sp. CF8]EON23721.1 hypothetical protein CF8_2383 [Nocardioides sp. CF8]
MSLMEALGVLAVPNTSDAAELTAFGDALFARVDKADLDDASEVSAALTVLAPEFASLAEAAARAGDTHAGELFAALAEALPGLQNVMFMDTADVALSSPNFLAAHGKPLAGALAERAEATRTTQGLQAYAYLEVLTRLGLTEATGKFRAMAFMASVTLGDSADLLERLPRLVGLAMDQWREDTLGGVLMTLLEHPDAQADALFELGQQTLRSALEANSVESVMQGLGDARARFAEVEAAEEARDDATIYRAALDVVVAFSAAPTGVQADPVEAVTALSEALGRRAAFSTRTAMGGWASPRRLAEAEWFALANTLRSAVPELGKPAWREPAETLSQVLAAYQAARSVSVISSDGLRVVLEPPVRAAFIAQKGLLEHLRAALAAGDLPEGQVEDAQGLLEAVDAGGAAGGDAVGKVWSSAPALAAALGVDADYEGADVLARAVDDLPEVVAFFNHEAEERARALARSADPVVDSLLGTVADSLANCEDFIGTVREELIEVVTAVLRFAADRVNAGRESWRKDIAYLFPPEKGDPPFGEGFLQKDVYKWLGNSPMRPYTRLEERDVAAGRADVSVTRSHRFVIEVKRELSDASRAALHAAYGGQAAAYSAGGPRVSLVLVLDLTDHSDGVPSLTNSVWVDEVLAGGETRHVITVVVRGNRPTPRQTMTGAVL